VSLTPNQDVLEGCTTWIARKPTNDDEEDIDISLMSFRPD
jgi:hypothetical protein